MKKLAILFLTLFLVGLPLATRAESFKKEKRDDTRYLAGAVPEVDGKVVFSKEFQIPGMSQAQIYDTMKKWMTERLKENNNQDSRVVYENQAEGTIAGIGEEWLVFRSAALMLDRSLMNYQITVTCMPNSCRVELEKIRYNYRETENYKAEEWITDKYALKKDKKKLVRAMAKWRRKTVDFADDLFFDVAVAFGAPDTRPKAQKKKEEENKATSIVAGAGPVVIGQGGKITATGKESADMPGYTEVDLKQIPAELYALIRNCKLVISIGNDEFNMTNMTASNGMLSEQPGKVIALCSLSADQPHEAMDKAENYTLKLYAPNQTTPTAVIECKKPSEQRFHHSQLPSTYRGEITKILMKK